MEETHFDLHQLLRERLTPICTQLLPGRDARAASNDSQHVDNPTYIAICPIIDWWKGSNGGSHVPLTEIYPTEETQFKMLSTRADNQQKSVGQSPYRICITKAQHLFCADTTSHSDWYFERRSFRCLKLPLQTLLFLLNANMPEIIVMGLEDHYENVKPNSRASADNRITVSRWGWLNCKSSNNIDFGRSNGVSIQLC
uniref:Uncharacterized protein n=1 Tax=Salix viminalis TaxID=40686 RepID=A0A6N2N1M9_SALVM